MLEYWEGKGRERVLLQCQMERGCDLSLGKGKGRECWKVRYMMIRAKFSLFLSISHYCFYGN